MTQQNTIIVGIGASAGGLEALQSLVSAIPSDSGFCYVIVQRFVKVCCIVVFSFHLLLFNIYQ